MNEVHPCLWLAIKAIEVGIIFLIGLSRWPSILKERPTMTPKTIRIELAKVMGWTKCGCGPDCQLYYTVKDGYCITDPLTKDALSPVIEGMREDLSTCALYLCQIMQKRFGREIACRELLLATALDLAEAHQEFMEGR